MSTTNTMTARPEEMEFDNAQALREGWALFNDGELQRIDCPAEQIEGMPDEPIFESDEVALRHVKLQAAQGSVYHAKALALMPR